MNKDLMIPFYKDGNMMTSDLLYHDNKKIKNHIFYDMMKISEYVRGSSSVEIKLINTNGNKYSMFLSEFINMTKIGEIIEGQAEGYWCFTKRGKCYSLKYLGVTNET